ncbi:MAG: hypothetical protein R2800_10495 [Flavipsychrobacter sp.]
MRHITTIIAIFIIALASCTKKETTPTNNNSNNTGCVDGYICFTLDGANISKQAGGYELADTFLFVKYEEGNKQLSIDIFGKNTGSYNVTDIRKVGNGRLYYFPAGSSGKMFMAEMGLLNISSYDATNRKVSGTFSGTLYEYDNNNGTFDKNNSVEIKNGEFNKVSVPK